MESREEAHWHTVRHTLEYAHLLSHKETVDESSTLVKMAKKYTDESAVDGTSEIDVELGM